METELKFDTHSISLTEKLQELYRSKSLCDLTLQTGSGSLSIDVHKVVLCASSDFFNAMFSSNWSETHSKVILLHGLSSDGLQAVVDFAYYGTLHLDKENVFEAVAALHHCLMVNSYWLCEKFLIRYHYELNFFDLLEVADKFNMNTLKRKLATFVAHRVLPSNDKASHIEEEEFLDERLYQLQPEFLMLVLPKWAYSEAGMGAFAAMEVIIKWADFNVKSREKYLPQLFSIILKREIGEAETAEILQYSRLSHEQRMQCLPQSQGVCTFLSGIGFYEKYFHSFEKDSYTVKVDMPEFPLPSRLESCEMAVIDDVLYACPSRIRDLERVDIDYEFFKYDQWLDRWILLNHMSEPRRAFPLVTLDGKLIAAGGCADYCSMIPSEYLVIDLVEIYTPNENAWFPAASLPKKLMDHAAASVGNKLFVSGGYSLSEDEQEVELNELLCYDLEENSWSYKQNMSRPRSRHQLVAHDEHLYQFGGSKRLEILECYDTQTDSWTVLDNNFTDPTPTSEFSILGAVSFERCLYLFYESQPSVKPFCEQCDNLGQNVGDCETCKCRRFQIASFDHKTKTISDIHVLGKFEHESDFREKLTGRHIVALVVPRFISKYANEHGDDKRTLENQPVFP